MMKVGLSSVRHYSPSGIREKDMLSPKKHTTCCIENKVVFDEKTGKPKNGTGRVEIVNLNFSNNACLRDWCYRRHYHWGAQIVRRHYDGKILVGAVDNNANCDQRKLNTLATKIFNQYLYGPCLLLYEDYNGNYHPCNMKDFARDFPEYKDRILIYNPQKLKLD